MMDLSAFSTWHPFQEVCYMKFIQSIFLPSWSIFPLDDFVLDCLDEFLEDDKWYDCARSALKQLPIDLLLTVYVNKI